MQISICFDRRCFSRVMSTNNHHIRLAGCYARGFLTAIASVVRFLSHCYNDSFGCCLLLLWLFSCLYLLCLNDSMSAEIHFAETLRNSAQKFCDRDHAQIEMY